MKDPYFEDTLILLCQYDETGALGIVINKISNISVAEILQQVKLPAISKNKPALWGGPVTNGACFVIFEGEITSSEGWHIQSKLAVSPSLELLKRRIANELPLDIAIGYSGWGPGQLDAEITKGSWLYADDIDIDFLFAVPISKRYNEALKALGLTKTTVWMTPIDE